jgi:hypothetical protein
MGEVAAPRVIYALTEPDTGEVRYIGQARHLWRRYAHHLLRIQGTPAKVAWLLGLQRRGLLPGVRVLEQVTADDVDERERARLFKAHGIRLVEHFDAGDCLENADGVVRRFLYLLGQLRPLIG